MHEDVEVVLGVAFEIPLVIFYLSILHLVPYKTFREQWRYIYVGLMRFCRDYDRPARARSCEPASI